MDEKKLLYGSLVVIVLLLLYILSSRPAISNYTAQKFDGMTAEQATASFTQQTAQIVQELKQALSDGIAAKNTADQLVAISDKYAQYSCDLNKAHSAFQIKNMKNLMNTPAPSPGR